MAGEALALTALQAVGIVSINGLLGLRSVQRRFIWQASTGQTQQIIPQVVTEEEHDDDMEITTHPVEQGASISDHAYKYPAKVTIKMGWSFSGQTSGGGIGLGEFAIASSLIPQQGDPNYLNNFYNALLNLQQQRILFNIFTGKRVYPNMLLKRISTTTTRKTESSLMVTAHCQEVLIVQTQILSVPPASVHTNPASTAPVQSLGVKQATPAPNFNGVP